MKVHKYPSLHCKVDGQRGICTLECQNVQPQQRWQVYLITGMTNGTDHEKTAGNLPVLTFAYSKLNILIAESGG